MKVARELIITRWERMCEFVSVYFHSGLSVVLTPDE